MGLAAKYEFPAYLDKKKAPLKLLWNVYLNRKESINAIR